jgi:hypothetical protein
MADKKISALTGASTPLAGTEVLPIVQSGATVKVAVSDLTAGRAVSTGQLTAAGVKGISTNTNASAGNVGEYISSTVAYNATGNLTTATSTNVTSISLTAGDWDVFGSCLVDGPGTTVLNYMIAGFSSTSATLPVYQYYTTAYFQGGATPFSTVNIFANPPSFRFSLSATTTIYLVVTAGFSVNTLTAGGYMAARRVQPGA